MPEKTSFSSHLLRSHQSTDTHLITLIMTQFVQLLEEMTNGLPKIYQIKSASKKTPKENKRKKSTKKREHKNSIGGLVST